MLGNDIFPILLFSDQVCQSAYKSPRLENSGQRANFLYAVDDGLLTYIRLTGFFQL
jgi:hypothetical protein